MLQQLNKYSDFGLLFLRLAVGAIFIVHGLQKLAMWNMAPNAQMGAGALLLMKLLSIIEPLAGLALVLGIGLNLAALVLAFIMLGAILMKIFVFKVGFIALQATGWELDLALLAANLVLFLGGGGKLVLGKNNRRSQSNAQ
jgi:putative oxidoreductase